MNERKQLLTSVQHWFSHHDQIAHYAQEAITGVKPLEQVLLASLQPQQRVLDCGCGAGRVARVLALRGCQVIGTDISRPLLDQAALTTATIAPQPAFVQVEPHQLPFLGETFDCVVAIKLYCYLPTQSLRRQYLHELARLLRPGGTLRMLHYLVFDDELHFAYDEAYEQYAAQYSQLEPGDTFTNGSGGGGYVHWFTEQALRSELEASTLVVERWEDDCAYGGQGYQVIVHLRKA